MQSIGSNDLFSVTRLGLLGEGSIESLGDLYLPLIGSDALGLYYALYNFGVSDDLCTFEALAKATKLPYKKFVEVKRPLEAIGLLRTYLQEDKNGPKVYSFYVYRPRSPFAFFDNVLLAGLLHETVGDERYAKLKSRYEVKRPTASAVNVSAPFKDVFSPNITNSSIYANSQFEAVGKGPAELDLGFDVSIFFNALKKKGLPQGCLSEEEMRFVERLGALYGYPSEVMGDFASDCIRNKNAFGARLQRNALVSACRGGLKLTYLRKPAGKSEIGKADSPLAKKIQLMDNLAPAKYLQLKQSGHQPATSDLKLLEKLTIDMGLPGPATNALLDYLLEKNGNVLSAALAEKIAAGLVREGVDNARDAMEILNKATAYKAPAKKTLAEEKVVPSIKNDAKPEQKKDDLPSDEELDALFDEAYAN